MGGLSDLRAAVAEYYNALYRKGHKSKYRAENVSIAPGGRVAVTRVVASLAEVHLGHFLPDYTAYEELLSSFKGFLPIPILLDEAQDYRFSAEELEREILGRGLSAVLASNPCNPTGQVVAGDDLEAWIHVARSCQSTLILDEFYSHYVYPKDPGPTLRGGVSAARYVKDVEQDPLVLINGLTKNWRYPGFRLSWIVGPERLIEQVTSGRIVPRRWRQPSFPGPGNTPPRPYPFAAGGGRSDEGVPT